MPPVRQVTSWISLQRNIGSSDRSLAVTRHQALRVILPRPAKIGWELILHGHESVLRGDNLPVPDPLQLGFYVNRWRCKYLQQKHIAIGYGLDREFTCACERHPVN